MDLVYRVNVYPPEMKSEAERLPYVRINTFYTTREGARRAAKVVRDALPEASVNIVVGKIMWRA